MVRTYIIMEQLSYEKGKFHQFYRHGEHRFVFMLDERYHQLFPEEYLDYFDRIEVVQDYTYENARELVIDELKRVASPEEIRLVCIDESNLLLVGRLREEFNIPGATYEQLLPFRDKVKMKETLSDKGIRVPRFYLPSIGESSEEVLRLIQTNIGFPIIAKPVDGLGSRNTYEIFTEAEFRDFCSNEQYWRSFEFEELILGTFYHCDSVVVDGQIQIAEVSQYTIPCLEFMKGRMLGSHLLMEGDKIRERIQTLNKQVIQSLCSWTCVTHLEVFHTLDDELIFIEIAARPAGSSIPLSIQNGIGINLNEVAYRIEFNMPIELDRKPLLPSAWISFPFTQEGIVRKRIEPILRSDAKFLWKVDVGERVSSASASFQASLEILLSNPNQELLLEDIEYLKSVQVIEVDAINTTNKA
ncbi:ATP-grasp domain-containing protein [Bacillus thuringiensis]|uniref:ATP-grasp domain-containing protein n=1 Tax=Bacillus thuringiensis TaxID=1428 RepID=UPI000BF38835|nr:hypothetical protein [Bacillus thuringiensis]PEV71279.1 hypothetical protein CN434_05260 [Bacillus thuringiensis]PFH65380.1 hypothetical protein COI56_29130 [Bacillus thuringiensis]PGO92173.1 hypothetical protein CN990_02505 [Bacillus thuringiensis]PGZ87392.1 hypothetical protein COE61_07880 [Bacillus thuringiensis]